MTSEKTTQNVTNKELLRQEICKSVNEFFFFQISIPDAEKMSYQMVRSHAIISKRKLQHSLHGKDCELFASAESDLNQKPPAKVSWQTLKCLWDPRKQGKIFLQQL